MRLFPVPHRPGLAAAVVACRWRWARSPYRSPTRTTQGPQAPSAGPGAGQERPARPRRVQQRAAVGAGGGGRRGASAQRGARRADRRRRQARRGTDPRPSDAGAAPGSRAGSSRRRPTDRGQAALEDQRAQLTDTVTDIYEQGDPDLLAFASLLHSQTTTDLTRQEALNDAIVGREDRAYDDLHAAEVLLQVRGEPGADRPRPGRGAAPEAADHLVPMQQLEQQARAALHQRWSGLSRAAATPGPARSPPARPTWLRCRRPSGARNHVKQLTILGRAPLEGRLHRPDQRAVHPSGAGLRHPPFGYREHPIYHYWGLHDGN